MKRFIPAVLAVVVVAAFWIHERMTTGELRREIERQRTQAHAVPPRHVNEHSLQTESTKDDLTRWRDAMAERARLQAELDARQNSRNSRATDDFPVSEWVPATRWENRGLETPHQTIETFLWAAAGGDVSTLAQSLELPSEVRTRAERILAHLPPDARTRYPNVESLIAEWTIKSIPVGAAQIIWSNQSDADHAVTCVFVKDPAAPPGTDAIIPAHAEAAGTAGEKAAMNPPSRSPNAQTIAAFLSLHRIDGRWRLVVPPSTVDKISSELAGIDPL